MSIPDNQSQPLHTKPQHLSVLDGIRGFACLLVVAFHCYSLAGQYKWPIITITGHTIIISEWLLGYGYSGVDLFFLLSGLCLAYPILTSAENPKWKRYAINRLRRILPAFWAAWLLFVILGWLVKHYNVSPLTTENWMSTDGSLRTFVFSLLLISFSAVWSYWTLPLEWRWYFVFPVIIYIRQHISIHCAVVGCFAVSAMAYIAHKSIPHHHVWDYLTALPFYLPTFGLGVYATHLLTNKNLTALELTFVRTTPLWTLGAVILFLVFPPQFDNPISRVRTFGIFYFCAVLAIWQIPTLRRFMESKVLVFCGSISYSLYLIHEPVVRGVYAYARQVHLSDASLFLLFQGLIFPICVATAYIFYLACEKPFLKKRNIS